MRFLPRQTSRSSAPRQPRPYPSSSLCDYTCGNRHRRTTSSLLQAFSPPSPKNCPSGGHFLFLLLSASSGALVRTQTLLSWARPWLLRVLQNPANLAAVISLLFRKRNGIFSSHTKKHANCVHITSSVFTSFLSPLDYTCSSQGVYKHTSTLGHITTPLYAPHHC